MCLKGTILQDLPLKQNFLKLLNHKMFTKLEVMEEYVIVCVNQYFVAVECFRRQKIKLTVDFNDVEGQNTVECAQLGYIIRSGSHR